MQPNTRPAAMLYVYAFAADEIGPFVRQCQQTAVERGFTVLGALIDTGPMRPLGDRPEWAKLRRAAEAGEIQRVVARWTSLVSRVAGEREREVTLLRRHGVRIEYADPLASPA